jgi:hypothetical protein
VADVLHGTVAAGQLDALGAAIRNFDFDAALLKLNEMSDQYRLDNS